MRLDVAITTELGIAGWLLDTTARALTWQWRIGGCVLLLLAGLWRAWRGGMILWPRGREP